MAAWRMRIQLNGESLELPDGETVAALIARMDLTGRRVAVELNLDIVPRSQHADTVLNDGDHVEVVHAIGGG
ncbi:sulfur carrier protein ThiS [Pseudomonas koreensis]|uniref:Sulfur carrier protein ThiS n=2 Tax=Pseudomonas TaxID=286 RepID=A0A2A2PUY8_9PSED|nr:sulfur carrier protein ThiS [Pseudomonas koreensis]KIK89777.1 thiamine biosynthesis protein ThiS [Pseudomonas sp. W15Feb9B]PAW53726.1 sulfur carrier protein ThiS [Pseudomonas moraviensis]PTT26790.1 sulfur carrier protein ThiS [Pseudomonas sp. HMWF021]NTZ96193.1 sulfur carrier protein ThiS [Pseudomonas koreensis]